MVFDGSFKTELGAVEVKTVSAWRGADVSSKQRSRLGIYVHVPFCTSVCTYCDFVKTGRFDRPAADAFFAGAETQLRKLLCEFPSDEKHCTLYFGGGTPGLFPAERFAPLIELVRSRFDIEECTIETNPWLSGFSRYNSLRQVGFSRLTIGVQSLCPNVLGLLGRKHTRFDALDAVSQARSSGFEQVQVDLIYGLRRGYRTISVADEIAEMVRAGATGVSSYALSLERRTKLFGTDCACDDVASEEYAAIYNTCLSLGMRQIETSNFSFFEAKHNNVYWYGWPYLSVGTGAHGLLPASPQYPFGRRYSVGENIREQASGDDFLPFVRDSERLFRILWEEERTEKHVFDEGVFTLLRTPEGVEWRWLGYFGDDSVASAWRKDAKIRRAQEEGRLILDERGLRLRGKEFLLGDSWALHLLSIADQTIRDPATTGSRFPLR
jgi:oxygen-independent coproporphyrinogen-3 oxidase